MHPNYVTFNVNNSSKNQKTTIFAFMAQIRSKFCPTIPKYQYCPSLAINQL